MISSTLLFEWKSENPCKNFRTGISLHGHTLHSHELLGFIPRITSRIPGIRNVIQKQIERYKRINGEDLNFNRGYWTPPLSSRQAFNVEHGQISRLGLHPHVSLTDHNEIFAPMELRAHDADIPISVEWTVPLPGSFIHLGIHNLPLEKAADLQAAMQEYKNAPDPILLDDVMATLHAIPEVLIVFNHPLWDEPKVGDAIHHAMIEGFLERHRQQIHAFELNGLRPWSENRLVPALADRYQKPLVSGGDRHAREPNACINLTNALDFSQFAAEVRNGYSEILFMNHYRNAFGARLMQNMLDVMADNPEHDLGWKLWSDRIFFDCPKHGTRSMTSYWGNGNPPRIVKAFVGMTRLLGHQRVRPAVQLAFGAPQECVV